MSAATIAARPVRALALPRQHFAGGGAEASALLETAGTLQFEHLRRIDAFQRRHGADCVSKFGDGTIHALCFLHERGERSRPIAGLRCVLVERTEDGEDLHFYQPDKHTAEGQEIAQQARAIGPFNQSDWLLERLDAHRCRITTDPDSASGLNLNYSVAFRSGELLVVTLPVVPDHPFNPPSWMRQLTDPEFRALFKIQMGETR
jgi:hypothetical protein